MKWIYGRVLPSLLISILLSINLATIVAADEEITEDEANDTDIITKNLLPDDLTDHWEQFVYEHGMYVPELQNKSIDSFIKGDESTSIKRIIKGMLSYLVHEIIAHGKLLGILIVLTLFSVVLQAIHSTFEKDTVSHIAYFVVYIVLIYLILSSFHTVFMYAKTTLDTMNSVMIALVPLLLGLIATSGQLISVSFFHPISIFLIHSSSLLMTTFVLPLLYLAALLMIVSYLTEQFQATHLASLFKSISLGAIGLFMTIFLGVMSVQGTATAIQDGIALKTAKFVTGNFIPVVGRTITDAADTALSATYVVKNSVGIIGLVILLFIATFPAIKMAVIAFIYKFCAAIMQPLGDSPVINSLHVISTYMLYMLAALVIVTFMFFLSIVILIAATNIPLLLT